MSTHPRSWLLVPGDRPEQLDAAIGAGADALVIDLYGAVADEAKKDARVAVDDWLAASAAADSPPIWLRINEGTVGEDDVQMLLGHRIAGIWMPAVSQPQPVADIASIIGRKPVELGVIFDSAIGLLNSGVIAANEKVRYLSLDDAALVAELGLDPSPDERELLSLRGHLVVVAAAFGKAPPVAAPWLGEGGGRRESEALAEATDQVRRGGHSGRFTTNAEAVPTINAALPRD